ncbi:MAG: substrate-binding domain-containing protein [Bacteroidetes bacterium]|nr:substrate-binding domain-containing protein [Bacteroidota bacterium]
MKNVRLLILLIFITVVTLTIISCNRDEKRESPTEGELTLISSEEIFPVMKIESDDFQRAYEKTKVLNLPSTTRDAVVQLLNDSVKLIIIPRSFNDEERSVIQKNEMEIDSTIIAYDAVAVIVNAENSLSQITTEQLGAVLSGSAKFWSNISGKNDQRTIVAAMGEPNSAVYEYLKTNITKGKAFAPIVYPCSTSFQILEFVQKHSNAIGFIGTAWIAQLPKGIKVLKVGDPNFKSDSTATALEFFEPHQAYIYQNFYPMRRTIFIYEHNVGRGVGLGLTSFIAGAQGQSIIVKNNLVPATMPVRLIQLTQK